MPAVPQREVVHDEYRYAKLQNNDQIFEIKAEKLKDLFVASDTLRDPRLARFKTEDVVRLEIARLGQPPIVLVHDKEKNRGNMAELLKVDAENA